MTDERLFLTLTLTEDEWRNVTIAATYEDGDALRVAALLAQVSEALRDMALQPGVASKPASFIRPNRYPFKADSIPGHQGHVDSLPKR